MEDKMSEDVEKMLRELDSASMAIKKQMGGKGGEGAEAKYGQAYQALVKVGAKPQLREKYR
jgi:hypothetical protein